MKTWNSPFFHGLKLEVSPLLSIQIFIGKCRKDIFRCLYEIPSMSESICHSLFIPMPIVLKIFFSKFFTMTLSGRSLFTDFKLRYDIRAQIL